MKNIKYIKKALLSGQIEYLSPIESFIYEKRLKKLGMKEKITLVNIICPGYGKRRDFGVEEFNFIGLSDQILECPNVILMLEKMNNFLKIFSKLGFEEYINIEIILADIAILNYEELSRKLNVKNTLDKFYESIKKSKIVFYGNANTRKMSELPYEFKKIPIEGVKLNSIDLKMKKIQADIREKANEYIGSLIFERTNKLMSERNYTKGNFDKVNKQTKGEVAKFVKEYGLAGLAINKIYPNPIVLFTEPSGYLRGHFYNSFLEKKYRLPVLFLC